MPWKAYSIIPIDFRWELLPSVEEVAARMAEDKAVGLIHGLESNIGELDRFFSDLQHAHTSLGTKDGKEITVTGRECSGCQIKAPSRMVLYGNKLIMAAHL
jgi:hypothetical protein